MPPTTSQKQIIALRSGNVCAMPACGQALVAERTDASVWQVVGEIAHIEGENPGSARYNAGMTPAARNAAANLIYLCPNHHTLIDRQPADWPAERLRQLKHQHETEIESAVREAQSKAMSMVSFAELEAVAASLIASAVATSVTFELTMPDEKLVRNNLSNQTRQLVLLGAAKAREVEKFVQMEAGLDSSFPDRLVAGFLSQYYGLVREGLSGDDLFDAMRVFAAGGSGDLQRQAAGLSILVYLFEKCDVFER